MKKILSLGLLVVAVLLFTSFILSNSKEEVVIQDESTVDIPENVQAIIDNSCFGCHNSESNAEKAREELEFDKLNSLKSFKLVSAMEDIQEVVQEGEMPPKKFLDKYPDNALSDEDKEILLDWARKTAYKQTAK